MIEQKPLLVVIAGPMGAGKTTLYDAHLKEAFPALVPPISHQREAALREQRSFAVEDLVVDTELLESIRMAHGGQSLPLSTIPESYEESLRSLPEARKHADDVLVYDNTPDGKGHRLVARFISGELVRVTHSSPDWLKRLFGRELCARSKRGK